MNTYIVKCTYNLNMRRASHHLSDAHSISISIDISPYMYVYELRECLIPQFGGKRTFIRAADGLFR